MKIILKELIKLVREYPVISTMYALITWICWFLPIKYEIPVIISLFGIINTGLSDDAIIVTSSQECKNPECKCKNPECKCKNNYIKNKVALSTIKIRLNNFTYILSVAAVLGVNLHKIENKLSLFFSLFLEIALLIVSVFLEKFEMFVLKETKKYIQ